MSSRVYPTTSTVPPFTWDPLALCRFNEDPDLHYPERLSPSAIAAAKAVCGRCRIREECLAWAVEHEPNYGVLGGSTPAERRAMRRAGDRR